MKTLKKTLCLVLAVVMAVGVLILPANAATFTDSASVSKDYSAAVTWLIRYGILQGKKNGDELKIDPKGDVTRAEVATMAYRMLTGDTAGNYVSNYVNYAGVFSDVKADWQRGPVGFAANGKLVVGIGGGLYAPNASVTGYELLAIMLRALGYGQLGEFTGAKWKENTYAQARKAGLDNKVEKIDLSTNLTREQVAQIIYNTTLTPRVVYTPGLGYTYVNKNALDTETGFNMKLIDNATFTNDTADGWGTPVNRTHKFQFTWPVTNVEGKWHETITANATYYNAVTECDVADVLGLDSEDDAETFTTYTNGASNKGLQTIEPTDEVHMIGAQGRETKVYYGAYDNGDVYKAITYRDTVLAVVTSSTPDLLDTAGHVIQKAQSKVTVYGNKLMEGYQDVNNFYGSNNRIITTTATVSGQYAKGTVLTAHVLTAANNTLKGQKVTLKDVKVANPVQVTVTGIKNNSGNYATGFVGSDGNTYLYAVSFGYNTAKASVGNVPETLKANDIGKTFSVYVTENTDADGAYNVVGIAPQGGTPNYGVVTKVEKIVIGTDENGDALYAQQLTVLKQDKMTDTILYVGNNATGSKDGNFLPGNLKGTLISYETNPRNIKYMNVTVAKTATANVVRPGVANTLTDTLVNDSTVFFVENYVMSNSRGGYVTNGYEVYNGFKTIPTLVDGRKVFDADNDKWVEHKNMVITYIDCDDNPYDAEYVLVRFGTKSSTPPSARTSYKYAYIDYERQEYTTYEGNYTFNSVIDGQTQQFVISSSDADLVRIGGNGLYIYDDLTNGNHGRVRGPVNFIDGDTNKWEYNEGVISLTTPIALDGVLDNTAKYLTLVDNCPIHIINPMTGEVTQTLYDLSVISLDKMYQKANLYVELNEYGWVDRVYVENNMKTDHEPGEVVVPDASYTIFMADSVEVGATSTALNGKAFYVNGNPVTLTTIPGGKQYSGMKKTDIIKIAGLTADEKVALIVNGSNHPVIKTVDKYGVLTVTVAELASAMPNITPDADGVVTLRITDVTYDVLTVTVDYPDDYVNADGKVDKFYKETYDFLKSSRLVAVPVIDGYVVDDPQVDITDGVGHWGSSEVFQNNGYIFLKPTTPTYLADVDSITINVHKAPDPVEPETYTVQIVDEKGGVIGTGTVKQGEGVRGDTSYTPYVIAKLNADNADKVIVEVASGTMAGRAIHPSWFNGVVFSVSEDGKGIILNRNIAAATGITGDLVLTVKLAAEAKTEDYTTSTSTGVDGVKTGKSGGSNKNPAPESWDGAPTLYDTLGISNTVISGNTITIDISKSKFEAGSKENWAKLIPENAEKESPITALEAGKYGVVGVTFVGLKTNDKLIDFTVDGDVLKSGATTDGYMNMYFNIAKAENVEGNPVMKLLADVGEKIEHTVSYYTGASADAIDSYLEWTVIFNVVA